MSFYGKHFKGKTVTLMGLGLLGRGVGDAIFLLEQGVKLTVTDLKTEDRLKESIDRLKDFDGVSFTLGEHRMEDFESADMVIKAAGVPLSSPYIERAHSNNVPVYMSTALFAKFTPAKVIGITGTKGKTTVSHLLKHILLTAGRKVFLGGNALPASTLAHLPESTEDEIVVLELDSWQLQGFGDLGISPSFSVFTNFMPDHLNYYKGDMEAYFFDKSHIFAYQKEGDVLVLGDGVEAEIERYCKSPLKAEIIRASLDDVPESWINSIPGDHNRMNASQAFSMALKLGVSLEICKEAFKGFRPVPGRLERLGSFQGRTFFNDNSATVPEATVASIRALKGNGGGLILILGGSDKDLPLDILKEAVESSVTKTFALPGSGTDRLLKMIDSKKVRSVSSLSEAVEAAFSISREGDTILFSPAFASFSQFNNEYEREESFLREVKERFSSDRAPNPDINR